MKKCKLQLFVDAFNNQIAHQKNVRILNILSHIILQENMRAYQKGSAFIERRWKISKSELDKWNRLSIFVGDPKGKKLFDCAFGSGRDLFIAHNNGYEVFGCELSSFLFEDINRLSFFKDGTLIKTDMRKIPFPDRSFDIIRHNASFLHMPIIGKGYTVHKVLEESHRILKEGGILYIYTKEGQGFVCIDTNEGMGMRSFQLYTESLLCGILSECGFQILSINHFKSVRNDIPINWIEVFAQKN